MPSKPQASVNVSTLELCKTAIFYSFHKTRPWNVTSCHKRVYVSWSTGNLYNQSKQRKVTHWIFSFSRFQTTICYFPCYNACRIFLRCISAGSQNAAIPPRYQTQVKPQARLVEGKLFQWSLFSISTLVPEVFLFVCSTKHISSVDKLVIK